MALWLFALLLGCAVHRNTALVPGNDRPIVGILTEPLNIELSNPATPGAHAARNRTFIAASYVKFAESAGARVVPVFHDAPEKELRSMFGKINGVILPGGGVDISTHGNTTFRRAAQLLYELAVAANDRGDPFPIHGTCLGFQLLTLLTAQDDSVLCRRCFESEGTPLPLEFTAAANASKLFGAMPAPLVTAVARENLTENSHVSGVVPEKYESDSRLREFYSVLSTNVDQKGTRFVSTIEARKYPITATQWHPEKNSFEWGRIGKLGDRAIPHSVHAVALSQYMADDFVARARLSPHRFASEGEEAKALIYNYPAVADPQGYYSQVYMWEGGHAKSTHSLLLV